MFQQFSTIECVCFIVAVFGEQDRGEYYNRYPTRDIVPLRTEGGLVGLLFDTLLHCKKLPFPVMLQDIGV